MSDKQKPLDLGIGEISTRGQPRRQRTATDRTLLSHLGFADPDKTEPKHDAACRYIVENQRRIVEHCIPAPGRWRVADTAARQEIVLTGSNRFTIGFVDVMMNCALLCASTRCDECHASMHQDIVVEVKIRPVPIGDALRQLKLYEKHVAWTYDRQRLIEHTSCAYLRRVHEKRKQRYEDDLASEAVERAAAEAEFHKQNDPKDHMFYWGPARRVKEPYLGSVEEEIDDDFPVVTRLVLVTAYGITEREQHTLSDEGIVHVRLGGAFEQWRSQIRDADSPEI